MNTSGPVYVGPAVPTAWDPAWQRFTNLTPQQIAAFQAFPQDLMRYSAAKRTSKESAGIAMPVSAVAGMKLKTDSASLRSVADAKQAVDTGALKTVPFPDADGTYHSLAPPDVTAIYGYLVRYVAATHAVAASLQAGINGKTITSRAQIDKAYAAITVS